jgi:hypothetical protein
MKSILKHLLDIIITSIGTLLVLWWLGYWQPAWGCEMLDNIKSFSELAVRIKALEDQVYALTHEDAIALNNYNAFITKYGVITLPSELPYHGLSPLQGTLATGLKYSNPDLKFTENVPKEYILPSLVKDGLYRFENGKFTAVEGTIESIPTRDYVVQLPKIDDHDKNVLKYQGDGTYKWVELQVKDGLDITLRLGPHSYRNICVEKEGDKRRCVNLRWLYLLMVTAGIEDEK